MGPVTFDFIEKACTVLFNAVYREVVYSTILFFFIWGLVRLLKRQSAYWRFGLWMLVFIRLVLPPDLYFPVSAGNLINQLPGINKAEMITPGNPDAPRQNGHAVSTSKETRLTEKDSQHPGSARTKSITVSISDKYISWPVVLAMAWFAGFVFSFFIFSKQLFGFYRVAKRAKPVHNEILSTALAYWRDQFGITRAVRIVSSDECLSPFTIGIFRPVIFIPLSLVESNDTGTLKSIIAHEMVHIDRLDDLWIKLQNLVRIFYFFHPVVWYANRQLNFEREQICDAEVLSRRKISPGSYGKGILSVLKLNAKGFGAAKPLPGFGGQVMEVEQRIRNIMKEDIMKTRNSLFVFLVIAIIGVFVLPMAPGGKASARDPEAVENNAVALTDGWFANKFDPEIYQKEKLPRDLLGNKINPNLEGQVSQGNSFQSSMDKGHTPGIDYLVAGEPVRAAAAGIVHFVGEGRPVAGNEGGMYVRVYHDFYDGLKNESYPRVTLYRNQAYRSTYYHLSKVEVKQYQAVKRGQVIGYGFPLGTDNKQRVKLVVEERGNFINADDYGPNHGFMNYADRETDREFDLEEMNNKLDRQAKIVQRLNSFYTNREKDNIYTKVHMVVDTEKYKNYPVKWATLDRFRYLAELYTKSSNLFPDLPPAAFEKMKIEFHINQPIVLTLPFTKKS